LGQEYWYRAKARDASGIESEWSNIEWSLQVTLADVVETVLDANSLQNENMKNALLNKIDAALAMINEGQYQEAMSKMESATSQKTKHRFSFAGGREPAAFSGCCFARYRSLRTNR